MKKRSDVTHKLDTRPMTPPPCSLLPAWLPASLPLGPVSSPAIKHKRMTLDAVKKNCLDNGHLMMRARRRQSDSHTIVTYSQWAVNEREWGREGGGLDAAPPPVVGLPFYGTMSKWTEATRKTSELWIMLLTYSTVTWPAPCPRRTALPALVVPLSLRTVPPCLSLPPADSQ